MSENDTNLFDDNLEAEVAGQTVEPEKQEVASSGGEEGFQVPEKFAGKSTEEIIESYVNLEKQYGRMGNDYGQLRKLTDEILQQRDDRVTVDTPSLDDINEELGFDDFIDDPVSAVDAALKNNPTLKKMEETLQAQAADNARKTLQARHSDYEDIVTSDEFNDWVKESEGRSRMFQAAHVNLDVDIAADLIDMYKAGRQVATDEATAQRDAQAQADLRQATVEKGETPASTDRTYNRQKLIQLKISNPAEYERRRPEIMRAYAEGRVK